MNPTCLQDILSQMLTMENSAVIIILEKCLSSRRGVGQQDEEQPSDTATYRCLIHLL